MVDTHSFDGRIDRTLLPLDDVHNLAREEKQRRGELVLQALSGRKPEALHYLQTIVNNIGNSANHDPSNDIWAEDLLCLMMAMLDNESFLNQLEEQLCDMRTGFCPQGRTTRLWQVTLPFYATL